MLAAWGRHREARELLQRIEASGPKSATFYKKLGLAAFWTGDLEESERCMRLALADQPDDWEHHFGLGMTLQARRKNQEASASFERALELNPNDRYCLANLVACEHDLEHAEKAEQIARRATDVHPRSAVAWSNLGVVLDRENRLDEALMAFERAAALSREGGIDKAGFVNHATCHLRAAQTREGITLLESKLCDNPNVQAHCHYALALLLSGRMREGWEQYEFRWVDRPLRDARPTFGKPAWMGQDIAGKTILLRSEQGFGDFFQFIRYAPDVKAMGARVLVQLHEAVRDMANGATGIDHVLKADAPYPAFDFHANLLSLPRIFGTDTSTIPADVPYLRPDPQRRAKWKARLAGDHSVKVGLVWAGSPSHLRDRFRSIRFDMLEPLGELTGVTFYSLQKGPAAASARTADSQLRLVDLESELHNFADTGAAIHELDLVICVDTRRRPSCRGAWEAGLGDASDSGRLALARKRRDERVVSHDAAVSTSPSW